MFVPVMYEFNPYRPRPVRFVELWSPDEWQVKIYSIVEKGEFVDDPYVLKAKEIAIETLGKRSPETHHGCAFVTIHIASMFNQIIVDWWAKENELRHLVFKADQKAPDNFANITCSGEAFCVWELKVIGFERDAWIEHVLERDPPSIDNYLTARLNTTA
jgi:hypothetical protein